MERRREEMPHVGQGSKRTRVKRAPLSWRKFRSEDIAGDQDRLPCAPNERNADESPEQRRLHIKTTPPMPNEPCWIGKEWVNFLAINAFLVWLVPNRA